jgi:protein-S-isoprenylcysteine O-methyltransferase Ste14
MSRLPGLGPRGEGWVLLQVVLLGVVGLAGPLADGAWSGPVAVATAVCGLVLILAGSMLAGRGLRDLGPNLTAVPRPRDGAHLVDSGLYGHVRHPIYGGLVLGALGWSLLWASPLALALSAVLALFFDLKARREEAWLASAYAEYRAYAERTRRFIPGLY